MTAVTLWCPWEEFNGAMCRRLRERWGIHPHHIAGWASVEPRAYMAWESRKKARPIDAHLREACYFAMTMLVRRQAYRVIKEIAETTQIHA